MTMTCDDPTRTGTPGSRRRRRRSTAATAVAVALGLLALAEPGPAAGDTADDTASVTELAAHGAGPTGLVLGPDGQLWFIADDSGGVASIIDATDPVARTTQDFAPVSPVSGLSYRFDGPLAFDGSGNLWLSASYPGASGDVLVRFALADASVVETPTPADCGTAAVTGLYAAGDGTVWLTCAPSGAGTVVERLAADGTATRIPTPAATPHLARLAPGAGGTMWTVGWNTNPHPGSVVAFGPDGSSSVFRATDGTLAGMVGNGSSVVEASDCIIGEGDNLCFNQVAPDGTQTRMPVPPCEYPPPANAWMDSSGIVWTLDGIYNANFQQVLQVNPDGTSAEFPLRLPAPDAGKAVIPEPAGTAVVTSDGALWLEEASPNAGSLVRFYTP